MSFLSPLRGLFHFPRAFPGLTPWAAFFRRFAAERADAFLTRSEFRALTWQSSCTRWTAGGGCPHIGIGIPDG